ncbi:hypothetical protein QP920_03650 [Corynebacterium marquesiae]|uniref:hypothetical protein n=1 Tax=Corynebacterium marquesiae TaxID=2913503 RepID=UPI00254E68D6|nr:hypothetical protein [Corynebacterium marquesiae]MDK8495551.1 hypothetical protein [Corynebacterium marquesiae]
MGARRTSRLIASAVAAATFSSITVVPTAVAADHTTFVEEKTTDDTVNLNGIEFDEDGNLLEENNAGDKTMEELDAEEDTAESITPYAVDGAEETAEAPASEESAKPSTLEELAQTEASNGDVNVKVVKDEQKDKTVTWALFRAQGMAIGRIDNADADVDMNNPDGAKKTVSGLLKFADGVFGKGTTVILKLFNAAVTIAGLVPGAGVAGDLKLSKDQQKSIEDSLNNISTAASDLAAVNAPAGQLCSDMLNGKKTKDQPSEEPSSEETTSEEATSEETTSEAPASEDASSAETTPAESAEETSTEETSAEEAATEEPTSEESTEPSTTEAAVVPGQDGKDGRDGEDGQDGRDGRDGRDGINGKAGKDADMSSVAGFSFLAALVGGGTVLGILSTIDYLYTHGMLPKNSVPWRINQ